MVRSVLLGGFAVGVLACSVASAFTCTDDSECSLSGQAGVCVSGNCAYPSDDCASGYVFPAGAGPLAGMCADADGGTGSSGPSGQTGSGGADGEGSSSDDGTTTGSSGGATVALDEGSTTVDDPTTGGTSFDSSDSSEETTGSETQGCNTVELVFEPIADAFMDTDCLGCELWNYGATAQARISSEEQPEHAMALRFDVNELLGQLPPTIMSADLELAYETDDFLSGTLTVHSISSEYPWVEGLQDGALAQAGESCWAFAQTQDVPWPNQDPTEAVNAELGSLDLDGIDPDGVLVVPLDVMLLSNEILNGADSILITALSPDSEFDLLSRESGQPPRVRITGC